MLKLLKNIFKGTTPSAPQPAAKQSKTTRRKPKSQIPLTEKELATQQNQPYIKIVELDLDPENINAGSLTFDWNDKFILNLIRAGYKQRDDDTDQIIVDRWFQTVCRNIALEMYEQRVADPEKRKQDDVRTIIRRDIGQGRTEVS